MEDLRYLKNVVTLSHNPELCVGCRMCETVCPHQIFEIENKKAKMTDKDACIECGACVLNCKSGAIDVTPGVGCAAYIISGWIKGKENASCDTGC